MTISIQNLKGFTIDTAHVSGIGHLLKEARVSVGYSIEDLAETSGLTTAEISKIEDEADTNASRIRRIANALRFELGPPTRLV